MAIEDGRHTRPPRGRWGRRPESPDVELPFSSIRPRHAEFNKSHKGTGENRGNRERPPKGLSSPFALLPPVRFFLSSSTNATNADEWDSIVRRITDPANATLLLFPKRQGPRNNDEIGRQRRNPLQQTSGSIAA